MDKRVLIMAADILQNKWEKKWANYLETNNGKGLEQLLDTKFVFCNEAGSFDRQNFLEEFRLLYPFFSYKVQEAVIHTDSDLMYSSCLIEGSHVLFNNTIKDIYRITKIWRRSGYGFKVEFAQATKLNPVINITNN